MPGTRNLISVKGESMKRKKANPPVPADNNQCQSPSLALMREYGAPMTREEFLNLNYMGAVPDEIPPEDEAEFPPQFQLNPDPEDDGEWEE